MKKNIDGWFLTLCRVRNHLWSFPDGVLLHTDCFLAAGSLRRFKSGWFRASAQWLAEVVFYTLSSTV